MSVTYPFKVNCRRADGTRELVITVDNADTTVAQLLSRLWVHLRAQGLNEDEKLVRLIYAGKLLTPPEAHVSSFNLIDEAYVDMDIIDFANRLIKPDAPLGAALLAAREPVDLEFREWELHDQEMYEEEMFDQAMQPITFPEEPIEHFFTITEPSFSPARVVEDLRQMIDKEFNPAIRKIRAIRRSIETNVGSNCITVRFGSIVHEFQTQSAKDLLKSIERKCDVDIKKFEASRENAYEFDPSHIYSFVERYFNDFFQDCLHSFLGSDAPTAVPAAGVGFFYYNASKLMISGGKKEWQDFQKLWDFISAITDFDFEEYHENNVHRKLLEKVIHSYEFLQNKSEFHTMFRVLDFVRSIIKRLIALSDLSDLESLFEINALKLMDEKASECFLSLQSIHVNLPKFFKLTNSVFVTDMMMLRMHIFLESASSVCQFCRTHTFTDIRNRFRNGFKEKIDPWEFLQLKDQDYWVNPEGCISVRLMNESYIKKEGKKDDSRKFTVGFLREDPVSRMTGDFKLDPDPSETPTKGPNKGRQPYLIENRKMESFKLAIATDEHGFEVKSFVPAARFNTLTPFWNITYVQLAKKKSLDFKNIHLTEAGEKLMENAHFRYLEG